MSEKRVAIAISTDYSLHNPSLVEGCKALACLGYAVDVLAPEGPTLPVSFNGFPVHVMWIKRQVTERHLTGRVLSLLEQFFLHLPKWWRLARSRSYLCFIGVEPSGLFMASMAGMVQGVPVIYYNMELLLSREVSLVEGRLVKALERALHRRASLTIVQDEKRAALLGADNGVPLDRMSYVPCGAMGPPRQQKSDYLRREFSIAQGIPIVLYAGKLAKWARVIELAEVAARSQGPWAFVFHGFPNTGAYVEDLRRKIDARPGRLFLSTRILPQDQFEEMLCSADVGVALYEDLGANFRLTGAASNKLAFYLKCGLPVVTNAYPSLREVVETYGCGVCISSEEELPSAVGEILSRRSEYSERAVQCFEERFDVLPYWARVMERVEGLAGAQVSR